MSHFMMNRRGFLSNAAAVGAIAATHSLINVSPGRAADPATIRMQLGWLPSNGLLGELVARKKGYYAESGVELEIVPGGPNVDGVAGVAVGQSTIGQISSSPSVMLARSAGAPIKAFAAGYQKHPFAYFSRKANPIAKPQDMIGKTIAAIPTSVILLRALLAKNGISEDQVKIVNMGSDMNQLVTGQADAVCGWLTNVNALKVLGDDRVDLTLWDGGIRLYANVYYTTDDQLENHADHLSAFVSGAARGWKYARDNQAEAVDILLESYPNLDKASELEAIGPLMKFVFNETTANVGWGGMERANWEEQIKTYADLGQFTGPVPKAEDVYTMAILDATADVRKSVG